MSSKDNAKSTTALKPSLWNEAVRVLKENDMGASTKPGPKLYPHQWSWDSAFIAIGLAYENLDRALTELETLFAAQWSDGRVPHIVFNPEVTDYFPGPSRWDCPALSAAACKTPATSGIVQPPVHALAALRIYEQDAKQTARLDTSQLKTGRLKERLHNLYPKLLSWHRYLATFRDPEKIGLITIYHPWESGMDNSPRWDLPLSKITVGKVPPYTRRDTKHVADVSERPTQAEYDRFLWLVECLKAAHYDDREVYKKHPFLVKDVLASAIFALANQALAKLAAHLERPDDEQAEIKSWQKRSGSGILEHCWDRNKKLALDLDVNAGCSTIAVSTCAGLAPLLIPNLESAIADESAARLAGADFTAHPSLKFKVIPSTTPGTSGFHPRAYWRGPSWPVIGWLMYCGLRQNGFTDQAAALRQAHLDLLSQPKANFGEYFELSEGTQLGSPDQSWTAAVVLDWLQSEQKA